MYKIAQIILDIYGLELEVVGHAFSVEACIFVSFTLKLVHFVIRIQFMGNVQRYPKIIEVMIYIRFSC